MAKEIHSLKSISSTDSFYKVHVIPLVNKNMPVNWYIAAVSLRHF